MVATGLALTLAGCNKKPETAAGDELVIKIGSVSPLTGPQAHLGKDNENGARLAVEELNAKGLSIAGKKARIELIAEDDAADPKTATIVAQRLIDAHVAGVIGHLNSGTSIPASKLYSDAGIVQISPSATAVKYTAQGFKTAFRVMTNDEQQGRVLGQYAAKLGKRVAIIDDRTAYGQGLADEVEKAAKAAGAEIVAREYTSDKATDFTAILTAIKGKQPDVIFFGGMDPQAAPMVRQMKRLGITAQFLGGDGMQTAEFLQLAGADAEGVIASSPGLPLSLMPGGKAFEEKFTAKYGKIQNYAPYAYDAVMVMVEAMRRANSTDPKQYLAELAKINYDGVTGNIQFDQKGDLASGVVTLYQVKGGKWEPLETVRSGGK
ncbi:branched-chain amino acid ABC transporter substrate-binding protein [Thiobacter aerophilum]|uniref:Branched-chain amino acid ABC transporter substrate-binding protein n=1 Tax=Thiobacter aerophilum TaxID=3121275 RepID=A0ABV0EDF3_9BURK